MQPMLIVFLLLSDPMGAIEFTKYIVEALSWSWFYLREVAKGYSCRLTLGLISRPPLSQ